MKQRKRSHQNKQNLTPNSVVADVETLLKYARNHIPQSIGLDDKELRLMIQDLMVAKEVRIPKHEVRRKLREELSRCKTKPVVQSDLPNDPLNTRLRSAYSSNGSARKKFKEHFISATTSFSQIGGYEHVLKELTEMIIWPLCHPSVYTSLGGNPQKAVLLHGPSGSGKSLVASAIATECCGTLMRFSAPEILMGVSGKSEETLRDIFEEAKKNSPCVLLFDDIDTICCNRTEMKMINRRITAQLVSCLDDLNNTSNGVFFVATTTRLEELDPSLRRGGRLDREIPFNLPNEKDRFSILKKLTQKMNLSKNINFSRLAKNTYGFVGADLSLLTKESMRISARRKFQRLENLRKEIVSKAVKNEPEIINIDCSEDKQEENIQIEMSDFFEALKIVIPGYKREGFTPPPKTTWGEIGGLQELHEELKMSVALPVAFPKLFERQGLQQPCGILLYGPPGCGKTLAAKAIANETNASFIAIKGPELLNSLVGETEKAIRSLFTRASICRPCIIFFDEIESLVPRRQESNTSSEVSMRVVTQMLTELDGLEERIGVFVIAATNRPDLIDEALLRPGRLGKSIFIPLPSQKSREQIFLKHLKNIPFTDCPKKLSLSLAQRTEGYSGADCAAVVKNASALALRKWFKERNFSPETESVPVKNEHFDNVLKTAKRSISVEREEYYERIHSELNK